MKKIEVKNIVTLSLRRGAQGPLCFPSKIPLHILPPPPLGQYLPLQEIDPQETL
jgi:hypothetical protein